MRTFSPAPPSIFVFRLPVLGWGFAGFFELLELGFFPAAAAFGEDAGEQGGGWLGGGMLGAPLGGQRAFHRRLQHRRTVVLQLRLHPLQSCHARIEVGEEFVERVGDALLLSRGRQRKQCVIQLLLGNARDCCPSGLSEEMDRRPLHLVSSKSVIDTCDGQQRLAILTEAKWLSDNRTDFTETDSCHYNYRLIRNRGAWRILQTFGRNPATCRQREVIVNICTGNPWNRAVPVMRFACVWCAATNDLK